MKKKLLLLLGVCLVVTSASSAFAAVMLKRMGDHPFCRPAVTTEADLRTMFDEQSADLQDGFVKAGNPELYAEFKAQFPTAEIEVIRSCAGTAYGVDALPEERHRPGQGCQGCDLGWRGCL